MPGTVSDFPFPVIGMIERQDDPIAYVAWNERDLQTCPFHEFLRTRRAKHTLVAANGTTQVVEVCRFGGIDWQRVQEVGPITQVVSTIVSLFNFPARITFQCVPVAPIPLSEVQRFLAKAVDSHPDFYTGRRSASVVRKALAKSKTFHELAVSVSNATSNAA